MHHGSNDQSAVPDPPPARLLPAQTLRQIGLVVPNDDQLALIRTHAQESGTLKELRQKVAAWHAAAEKLKLGFEEMTRVAVFQLEVERDLGSHLAQTVRRGGDRSKSHGSTLLHEDIHRNQSSAYQKLAAIPEDVFRAYLEHARSKRKLPSSAGARRFGLPKKSAARRNAKAKCTGAVAPTDLAAALDAISRVMTPDVVVGEGKVEARRFVSASDKGIFDKLSGDVLVVDCPDPAEWIPELLRRRGKAKIRQVIAFVPAAPWEEWFEVVQESGVSCCFLHGPARNGAIGHAVLHIGACDAAFRVAMASVGLVLHA